MFFKSSLWVWRNLTSSSLENQIISCILMSFMYFQAFHKPSSCSMKHAHTFHVSCDITHLDVSVLVSKSPMEQLPFFINIYLVHWGHHWPFCITRPFFATYGSTLCTWPGWPLTRLWLELDFMKKRWNTVHWHWIFLLDFLGSWDRQGETFRWSRRFPQTPHPRRGCRWRRTCTMRVEGGWKRKGFRNVYKAKAREIESFIRDVLIIYIGRDRYTLQWTIWQMVITVQRHQKLGTHIWYTCIYFSHTWSIRNAQFDKPVGSIWHICRTYVSSCTYAPFERAGPFAYPPKKKKTSHLDKTSDTSVGVVLRLLKWVACAWSNMCSGCLLPNPKVLLYNLVACYGQSW